MPRRLLPVTASHGGMCESDECVSVVSPLPLNGVETRHFCQPARARAASQVSRWLPRASPERCQVERVGQ